MLKAKQHLFQNLIYTVLSATLYAWLSDSKMRRKAFDLVS